MTGAAARWLFGAGVALSFAACSTARIPRVPGDPPPAVRDANAERDYEAFLDQAMQSTAIYDNLDSKVFFRAVWQSPKFVEARKRREAMFKDMPEAEAQAHLDDERARLKGATEFFLGVHSTDSKYEDFSRSNTMWRIVMIDGDKEIAPVEVERLGRTSVEMRSYYTFMESFWVGYRLRFPAETTGPVRLRLSSALGRADLDFKAE